MSSRKIAAIWIAVIAFIALAGVAFWGFRVATSDIKGQGDATIIKNSATNRIVQQAQFEQIYAEVKSAKARITVATKAAAADPSYQNQTNLTGITNHCITTVEQYNALARTYTAENFRAVDLPAQLSTTTYCEGK